jgi:hypothetical protein
VWVRDRREAILSVGGGAWQSHPAAVHPSAAAYTSTSIGWCQALAANTFWSAYVYFEDTDDIGAAIAREKQLKSWRRSKKIALIHKVNPEWSDLSRDLIEWKG